MKQIGLGDLIYYITKNTGIHWMTKKISKLLGFENCGCDERRKKFNQIKINRNG